SVPVARARLPTHLLPWLQLHLCIVTGEIDRHRPAHQGHDYAVAVGATIDLEARAENGDAVGADMHDEWTSVMDDIEDGTPLQQADVPVPPTEARLQAG